MLEGVRNLFYADKNSCAEWQLARVRVACERGLLIAEGNTSLQVDDIIVSDCGRGEGIGCRGT